MKSIAAFIIPMFWIIVCLSELSEARVLGPDYGSPSLQQTVQTSPAPLVPWSALESSRVPPSEWVQPPFCQDPPENGEGGVTCYAAFPKYTFSPTEGRCVSHIFGGCFGTQNLFDDFAECEKTCNLVVPQPYATIKPYRRKNPLRRISNGIKSSLEKIMHNVCIYVNLC